ncbi:MAG: alpha/beta fold hydrolase [Bacilli bacterium]
MEKKHLQLANGETLAYLQQGSGEIPLVLIHGNLSSSLYFLPLLKRLPQNVSAYAFDLRGFGDSTYHQPITSLKSLAEDLILAFKALKIKKAHILGWSLGGGVAMELAAMVPEFVDKLILLASTTHKGYPIFKKNAGLQPLVGEIYASASEMASDPLQVKPVIDAINHHNSGFLTYIYDLTIYSNRKPSPEENDLYISETMKQRNLSDVDYALATFNMSDAPNFYRQGDHSIEKIMAKTLHIWGSLDKTVFESMVMDNVQAIKHSTFLKWDDCGHSPLVDKPDELAKAVLDFIK